MTEENESDQIEALRKELEQTQQSFQQYAYAVSHDFSAPLRQIDGFLSLIHKALESHIEGDTQRHFDFVNKAVNSSKNMLEGLLSFSRLESRAEEPAQVDLNQVLLRTKNQLTEEIAASNAIINNKGLPTVLAEPNHMAMLLEIILKNALTFQPTGQDAHIEISSQSADKQHILSFEDNGLGLESDIAEEDAFGIAYARLFLPLKKGTHGKLSSGPGIGLTNAKRIVTRMGGSIAIAPAASGGAIVTITLPY